ncbi:MAG: hypothetical protein ACXU8S_14275, partial [Phenylobacterium sp.]
MSAPLDQGVRRHATTSTNRARHGREARPRQLIRLRTPRERVRIFVVPSRSLEVHVSRTRFHPAGGDANTFWYHACKVLAIAYALKTRNGIDVHVSVESGASPFAKRANTSLVASS